MLITQIRNKMNEKKISVHALEKQAGLKSSAIHNILYGRSKNPSIKVVQAIAHALECDISELLEEERPSTENNRSNKLEESAREKENTPWDAKLYLSSFEKINLLINKNRISLTKDKILNIVEEVYLYSQKTGSEKVDIHFAEWIINKNI